MVSFRFVNFLFQLFQKLVSVIKSNKIHQSIAIFVYTVFALKYNLNRYNFRAQNLQKERINYLLA